MKTPSGLIKEEGIKVLFEQVGGDRGGECEVNIVGRYGID